MSRYIFLDNWVYPLLSDEEAEQRLAAFLQSRDYTVLITSVSVTELYNPGWRRENTKDRSYKAACLWSQYPCVIVDPPTVWRSEFTSYPDPLTALPIELDLHKLPRATRLEALLKLLERDKVFLDQGKDIRAWSNALLEAKKNWLPDVQRIIENAVRQGYLVRNRKGNFTELEQYKEVFLMTLDLRLANQAIDPIFARYVKHKESLKPAKLTAIRLSSLCFWYLYVAVDPANKLKQRPSDLVDIEHISLLPYCAAFTVDGTMSKMLQRVKEPASTIPCEVITEAQLRQYLVGKEK